MPSNAAAATKRVPLVGGPQSSFRFYRPDGSFDELQLLASVVYDPLSFVHYARWACGEAPLDAPGTEAFAELIAVEDPQRANNQHNLSPVAHRAFRHLPPLFYFGDTRGFEAVKARVMARVAAVLEIWPSPDGGDPEMGFTRFNTDGSVDPTYTTGRRPVDEVAAILGAPDVEYTVTRI